VSVDEIRSVTMTGWRRSLTNLLESPLLVILSVIDGLYDGDPAHPASKLFGSSSRGTNRCSSSLQPAAVSRGTGGMQSKLEAARNATAVGENVLIADGRVPNVLGRILAGEEIGTLFLARSESVPAWKAGSVTRYLPEGHTFSMRRQKSDRPAGPLAPGDWHH